MNAWLPQASYPCGNFSDTSSLKFLKTKGSIGHAFTVCIHTENQNQRSFYPFVLRKISVLTELLLGHLCYRLTDVPPQPNSPPDNVHCLVCSKPLKAKGSIGHAFAVCIRTENQNQRSFYPFVLHEISVLIELLLGHLCYRLTDVPPQPNSPPDFVSRAGS